jgi:hypothetical protein
VAERKQKGDGHSQRWRENNPEKNRQYYLATVYKITPEKYDELFEKQKGRCAICRSTSPGRKRAKFFCVDHDHATGQVRGLLCIGCNLILGHARDHVGVLQSAIDYLNEHGN